MRPAPAAAGLSVHYYCQGGLQRIAKSVERSADLVFRCSFGFYRRCAILARKATSTNPPDTAMIAGLVGRSKRTDSENPIRLATRADTTDHKKTPAMLRDTSSPVTAGSTRKLNTSITPADCIANAITTPSVK